MEPTLAASAAASITVRIREALLKSIPVPIAPITGSNESAKMIATLPSRFAAKGLRRCTQSVRNRVVRRMAKLRLHNGKYVRGCTYASEHRVNRVARIAGIRQAVPECGRIALWHG